MTPQDLSPQHLSSQHLSPQHCAVIDGKLVFESNGVKIALEGTTLRSNCRCAECQYIARSTNAPIHSETVTILAASPLGYGVQLHFSDGHRRGVFPWSYLAEIAAASNT